MKDLDYRAPSPDEKTRCALFKWLPLEPEENPLMAAGALLNVERFAAGWGPILIQALVESGRLQAEGDPAAVLDELIYDAGRAAR
jgi:hypothetical protein